MIPPNYRENPLPERVAVLEAVLPTLQAALIKFDTRQEHQDSLLNTITVNLSSLKQTVDNISTERSRWKDPMLYVAALSVITAIAAVFLN
jgi:hypothetical protein